MLHNSTQELDPTRRLYIDAVETLHENTPSHKDLTNALWRVFFAYLRGYEGSNDEEGKESLNQVAYHFNLLMAFLHTIDPDFPENHTDFREYFEKCMETYHAVQDSQQTEEEE